MYEDSFENLGHDATARWTSSAYKIQFGQVDYVTGQSPQDAGFNMSAWGISENLRALLADFTDAEIASAVEWLTIQQNAYLAILLEEARSNLAGDLDSPILEQLFIAIDAELFLPRGLRLIVTCVTNIVQAMTDNNHLDKFVAVLDPGEAKQYIVERRDINTQYNDNLIH